MKLSRLLLVFSFAAICLVTVPSSGLSNAAVVQEGHGGKHGFHFKQYEDFHAVLHPLQHEALPNKDFKEIRAKSALLTRQGRAIVKLGVPRGASKENRAEFITELNKFNKALKKYRSDAKHGTDTQLEASYSAVHDSFELLAAMLPRS
ncbi:MAG TPA: hypothetical protein VGO68_02720 [Pyrinomonadaceae bacterium]|nr:hypothetical protein [Pyrinomonadaceae bacterium]